MRRIQREHYGALAQCKFCEWARFVPDRKRSRYSALARAAASLRAHARLRHADKFPKFSTAEQIFAAS